MRPAHLLAAFLPALLTTTWGAEPAVPTKAQATAEIRIALPGDVEPYVAVEPGERLVIVELPRGSVFPLDFPEMTGGLVREGAVASIDGARQRLELTLAGGYLARVAVEAGELVLRFESRGGSAHGPDLPEEAYRLGADDKVAITVHNHPELSATLTVSHQGLVTAPLVGEMMAAGLSPSQFASSLADRLERSFLVDPQVDVAVTEYRSQWVMVSGEVSAGGRVPLRGGTRLKEVLSEAGGFREGSGQEIVISRPSAAGGDDYETMRIERAQFEAGLSNPLLQSGDIIDVPRAAYCYVQGEVRLPGRIPIERGTTLLRAITQVGGLTEWADLKSANILYPDGRTTQVNLKRIQTGRDEDPPLRGEEVIVIGRRFF